MTISSFQSIMQSANSPAGAMTGMTKSMKTILIVLAAGLSAFAGMTLHSEEPVRDLNMKLTVTSGKLLVEHAKYANSVYTDVDLAGSAFENVNLTKVRMHNINLSDLDLSAAQIGGATFKHIGPPPAKDGKQDRQRPVTFEEAMLCDSTFTKVDLSNVKILDCNIEGMTIDGVLVTEMIAAYKKQKK